MVPLHGLRIVPAFAVLGAVSGGIAALVWPWFVVPGLFYGAPSDSISLSPAITFAIALAAGLYVMVTRRPGPIAAIRTDRLELSGIFSMPSPAYWPYCP